MPHAWSEQQEAIFAWFKSGSGNLVVRARAGTGKTTTILEAIRHAPERRVLLAAFNKVIAEELQSRLQHPGAEAKTLHALGFSFVRRAWKGVRVDSKRKWQLARRVLPRSAPDAVVTAVAELCARARETMPHVGEGLEHAPRTRAQAQALQEQRAEAVFALCDLAYAAQIQVDPEHEAKGFDALAVAGFALDAVLLATERTDTIDFSDMIFLPIRNGWIAPSYDLVCVDEAQDMTPAQLELAQGACRAGGRIAIIGDDRQAIYGWRGAALNGIDQLKLELAAAELGLTITYRCPKSVVALAAALVPDFAAADSAPEGQVLDLHVDQLTATADTGDFILSRTNAPLAGICLSLLRAGKKARIRGRDIGAGLRRLAERQGAKTLPELFDGLAAFAVAEERRMAARVQRDEVSPETAAAHLELIEDQREVLHALCDGITELGELYARLESLFSDNDVANTITCSTVHRAKGLEASRVFILERTLRNKQGELREGTEEENIRYVAITRAKQTLVWARGGGERREV